MEDSLEAVAYPRGAGRLREHTDPAPRGVAPEPPETPAAPIFGTLSPAAWKVGVISGVGYPRSNSRVRAVPLAHSPIPNVTQPRLNSKPKPTCGARASKTAPVSVK